jgi:plastocyanin
MHIRLLTLLVLSALAVFALACGDDDDDTGDDANGDVATTAPAAATDEPTDAATDAADETDEPEPTEDGDDNGGAAETVTIAIANFAFDPSDFTVPAGAVLFEVSNADSAPHTFTVYADEAYTDATDVDVSVGAGSSGSGEGTFEAGPFFFRCELHPDMQGTFTAE